MLKFRTQMKKNKRCLKTKNPKSNKIKMKRVRNKKMRPKMKKKSKIRIIKINQKYWKRNKNLQLILTLL
jgi:hypothetical protein